MALAKHLVRYGQGAPPVFSHLHLILKEVWNDTPTPSSTKGNTAESLASCRAVSSRQSRGLSRGCSWLVCHQTCLCVWVATPPHSRQVSHAEDSSLLGKDSSFALFHRTKAGQDSGAAVQSLSTQMFCDKGAGCLRHGGKNVPTWVLSAEQAASPHTSYVTSLSYHLHVYTMWCLTPKNGPLQGHGEMCSASVQTWLGSQQHTQHLEQCLSLQRDARESQRKHTLWDEGVSLFVLLGNCFITRNKCLAQWSPQQRLTEQ